MKGDTCSLDGTIDVRFPCLWHLRPGTAGGGIDAFEAGFAVCEFTVDVTLEALHVPYSANAGMTSAMKRSSEAFLRSNVMPVSIQKEYSSYPIAS